MTARGRVVHLTLEQIGARAGVSRSTVSRVLNDHPDVRADVRARVEAVIEETGYQPNPAARALVSKRSGLIGLVMLTNVEELFGDPYYSALVNGIQQGCVERDLIFAIFPAHRAEGRSDALTPQIAQRLVDGVIVTAVPESDRLIAELHDRGKHMVVIGHPDDTVAGMTRVDVENRAGSATAVAHLVAHGRRRIGYVGPTIEYRFGRDRRDGYHDAVRAAGLASVPELEVLDDPTVDGEQRAAARLLAQRPDAVYVATDTMADGLYRTAAAQGWRIPDDLAVVGFDGLPRGPQLDPPLTTIVQPVIDVGRTAVGLLAGDDEGPRTIILPTALRPGASCGTHDTADADHGRPVTWSGMDAAHQLDRAAARRVLRQASAAEPSSALDADRLDTETIVAAALDAGIAETEVRHALVERLGAPPDGELGDRLLGAGAVAVDDEVPGSPGEVLLRLDAWLVDGHHLRRDRLRDGRAIWRRRSGMLGATYRTLRHATGEGHLGEVRRIDAAAIDTGHGTCVVRVTADRRRDRVVRAGVGGVVATLGAGVVLGLAAVTAPVVLVAAPFALAAGAGLAATGRGAAADLTTELERVLDAVGHKDRPGRLGAELVRRTLGRTASDGPPPPPA